MTRREARRRYAQLNKRNAALKEKIVEVLTEAMTLQSDMAIFVVLLQVEQRKQAEWEADFESRVDRFAEKVYNAIEDARAKMTDEEREKADAAADAILARATENVEATA